MSTNRRKATTRKVIGSLGVIGAAAAVAGLGTFGTFTDTTAPVDSTVATGKVDINLAQTGHAVPVTISDFVPGDSMTRAVTLTNDGTVGLSSVSVGVTTTTPSVLTSDGTNGLQLTIKSCPVAWTQGGTAQAPTYTCASPTTLLSKSVIGTQTMPALNSLNAGGTDHLTFTVSLPTTADNTFQGKSSSLSLTFSGIQRDGTAR